jgi:hypothetical protein
MHLKMTTVPVFIEGTGICLLRSWYPVNNFNHCSLEPQTLNPKLQTLKLPIFARYDTGKAK